MAARPELPGGCAPGEPAGCPGPAIAGAGRGRAPKRLAAVAFGSAGSPGSLRDGLVPSRRVPVWSSRIVSRRLVPCCSRVVSPSASRAVSSSRRRLVVVVDRLVVSQPRTGGHLHRLSPSPLHRLSPWPASIPAGAAGLVDPAPTCPITACAPPCRRQSPTRHRSAMSRSARALLRSNLSHALGADHAPLHRCKLHQQRQPTSRSRFEPDPPNAVRLGKGEKWLARAVAAR